MSVGPCLQSLHLLPCAFAAGITIYHPYYFYYLLLAFRICCRHKLIHNYYHYLYLVLLRLRHQFIGTSSMMASSRVASSIAWQNYSDCKSDCTNRCVQFLSGVIYYEWSQSNLPLPTGCYVLIFPQIRHPVSVTIHPLMAL